MFNKKSQITIFIIVGIVILFSFALLFYISKSAVDKEKVEVLEAEEIPLEVQPVKMFVESCIRKTAEEGIYFISLQGGYYDVPEPKIEDSLFQIPYYFYLGKSNFPEKSTIKEQYNIYIKEKMTECIGNFESFRNIGYDFEVNELSVKTSFNKKTSVIIDYPISIKKGSSETKIDEFIYTMDFDFNLIYDILVQIKNEQIENINYVPLGATADFASHYNFTFEIIQMTEDSVVYTLIFNKTKLPREEYLFTYAAKYDWRNLTNTTGKKVEIEEIAAQTAYVDYEFSYQVKAKGNNLKFSDYSTLFDIDENTGEIKFIPTNEQGGKHFIIIKAEDENGDNDTEIFELEIKESNQEPYIYYIPLQNINAGELSTYYVNASDPDNDSLFYLDDSDLFNININTGLINFTPNSNQKGSYTMNITVVDNGGLSYTRQFKMVVS